MGASPNCPIHRNPILWTMFCQLLTREFVLCHNCPRLIGDRINSAERRIKESCVLIRVGMFMMTYLSEQVPCLPSFDGCYEFCVC